MFVIEHILKKLNNHLHVFSVFFMVLVAASSVGFCDLMKEPCIVFVHWVVPNENETNFLLACNTGWWTPNCWDWKSDCEKPIVWVKLTHWPNGRAHEQLKHNTKNWTLSLAPLKMNEGFGQNLNWTLWVKNWFPCLSVPLQVRLLWNSSMQILLLKFNDQFVQLNDQSNFHCKISCDTILN